MIAEERHRQQTKEGWTKEHDATHILGEIAKAAMCYVQSYLGMPCTKHWPWNLKDLKPNADPVRDLVKAGALIAAEIDRVLEYEGEGLAKENDNLRRENKQLRQSLNKIAGATRIDGLNQTFMEWSDMKALAKMTLSVLNE